MMSDAIERDELELDVCFVGAGPSGLAGAIHLADLVAKHNQEVEAGGEGSKLELAIAVIDKAAYKSIKSYIDRSKRTGKAKILFGGNCDDSTGYFIDPTLIEASDPQYLTMCEEVFGPVLTVYVYADSKYEEILETCDRTSPYALTGAVFARDRRAALQAQTALVQAAGNFYINDKPTGAVVGQQPFGGARASGTNDKAGSPLNMLRWCSPRSVKENFVPPKDHRYPFMDEA